MDRNTRGINNHTLSRVFSQLFYDNSPLPEYTPYSAYNEGKSAQKNFEIVESLVPQRFTGILSVAFTKK